MRVAGVSEVDAEERGLNVNGCFAVVTPRGSSQKIKRKNYRHTYSNLKRSKASVGQG